MAILFHFGCAVHIYQGQATRSFPGRTYRGLFKANKVHYDGVTIDRVEASGSLAYVLYFRKS